MIYTKQTKKAMNIAYNAHLYQVDKAGVPYIFHPMHVAEQMKTEEECIVALLHDVVEDTNITLKDLEKDFSKEIIEALKLMTHNDEEDYLDYVKKLKKNPIARKVKLEDLKHNTTISRLGFIGLKDLKRLRKYKKAIKILSK